MRLRRSRTNDKKIGESGDAAQIEHNNVFRFFVGRELSAKSR
jgi:hypothetical protein